MIIFEKIAILGVGLMGGSLALAAKDAGVVKTVVGWSRTKDTLDRALANSVIDIAEPDFEKAIVGVDCIIIATPAMLTESLLIKAVSKLPSSVAITDVSSVKGNLLSSLIQQFGEIPKNVVLGHPIAGSEHSGVSAAKKSLYNHHKVILINDQSLAHPIDSNIFDRVRSLWKAVGAEVLTMSVDDHDEILSLTSHLPHLLAYALVKELSLKTDLKDIDISNFSAGGLRDFTRIASSDPVMWREICLANKKYILESLSSFKGQLDILIDLVDKEDSESIESIFNESKDFRDKFFNKNN